VELANRNRYHKAITGELEAVEDEVAGSEKRRVSGRLCDRRADEHSWARCLRRFHYVLPQVYRAALRGQPVALQWQLQMPAADGSSFDWGALERDHGDSADSALRRTANFDWDAPERSWDSTQLLQKQQEALEVAMHLAATTPAFANDEEVQHAVDGMRDRRSRSPTPTQMLKDTVRRMEGFVRSIGGRPAHLAG
jgi:hypothetical protein